MPVMLTAEDFSDQDSSCDTRSSSENRTDFEDNSHTVVRTAEKPLPSTPRDEPECSKSINQWHNDAQSAFVREKQYLSPVYETTEDADGESDRYGELPCIYVP